MCVTVSTYVIFQLWHTGCFILFWWQTAASLAIFVPCSQTRVSFSPCVTLPIPHICLSNGSGAALLMLHYDGRHQGSLAHHVCPARQCPATHSTLLFYTSYSVTHPTTSLPSPGTQMHGCNQRKLEKVKQRLSIAEVEKRWRFNDSYLTGGILEDIWSISTTKYKCALPGETEFDQRRQR